MKLRILLVLVVGVLFSAAAAGAARADDSLPAGVATVQCGDGATWVVDTTLMNVESFGDAICAGDYVVQATGPAVDSSTVSDPIPSGTDVGFGAAPFMAPDPTQYSTEVKCPDGTIWAVAAGDDFVCPAA